MIFRCSLSKGNIFQAVRCFSENVDVTRQEDIKNVIKRGGHRACFHATMLTNTVI